jgi:threonine synthase
MIGRRIALIGYSGAGKSSCLFDRETADMDAVLGIRQPPSLEVALDWLTNPLTPSIVVVSNHEEMLKRMREAKKAGLYPEKFSAVCFVYLKTPKVELESYLKKQTAEGYRRDVAAQRYTLDHYDCFDSLFTDLADCIVDCSLRSVDEVAAQVKKLAQLQTQND